MPGPDDTPGGLLRDLAGSDPTRPRLTFYDDVPGPTRGERIELSGKVLANWVAKAANLLQEELEAGPGSVVQVDLPAHWRAAYWLLATWSVGAQAVVGQGVGGVPDVLVTASPPGRPAGQVVAVTLAALARSWGGADALGSALDEARELATYGDRFEPWARPGADDPALTTAERTWTYAELVPAARAAAGRRGLAQGVRAMTSAGPQDAVSAWLAPWVLDGSLVLVRPDESPADPATSAARTAARIAAERVTSA